MNDSERTNHRLHNSRTTLNITSSLSTTDNPAPNTPPPKLRINTLDITQGRAVSEKVPENSNALGGILENQGQQAVDQWKSFQRFSRLKLEQMFPTNPKPSDDQPGTPGTLKLKSETTRSLSRERAENKSTMNQKLVNIEERLKKLNGFLMNEFEEKKKYFKELRLPQALTAEAREKIFSFLKQEPARTEANPQEERKSEESAPMEEQKEGSSEDVSDSKGQTRSSMDDEVLGNNVRTQASSDERQQQQSGSRTAVNGEMESPLHGRPSINLGGDIDVGINREYTGNENGANAGEQNPVDNNLQTMASREAHFRLRKALITFLSVCLSSTFLLLMYENRFSHRAFFMVLYGFFLYFLIEGCKKAFANEGIQWKRVENIFNIIDVTSSLFFLAVVDLRICGLISTTSFVTVMPGLSCTLYYFCSKAPKSVVESQAVTRTLFAIQIFLITAKIDGTFDWPWKTVLCLMWGYLAMMVLYFILLTFMMILMVVLSIFRISLYQNMDTKTQIIGFFWYLCYVGMGPLLFVVMIGVCEAFDHKQDLTFLGDCLTFAKYYSIAIILLTQFTYSILVMFLQKFNIDEPEFRIQFGSSDNKPLTKIEVEKRDIYLVMMSSTYFLPLKQSFFVKSKENLKRVKRAIVSTRNRGRKAVIAAGDAIKKRVKTKSEEPVNVETLKKNKDELTKKFKFGLKKTTTDSSRDQKKKSEPRGIPREKSCNDMILLPFEREISKGADMYKSTNTLKYKGECFSEGDKDYLANWEALNELEGGQKQQKDNENLCYVCFDRAPNAVILKCGHGGICYECAMQFAKEKNQCMECRAPIENVVKINPTPKMRNIIKGYETTKLIAVNQEDE